ncbi:aminodeoxychorismate synthase component I [Elusimicrobiota bacterium]
MLDKQLLNDCFFWFETNKVDNNNHRSLYFNDPVDVLILTDPDKKEQFFSQLEEASGKYWLAGFFGYEMGYLFEKKFKYCDEADFPYALFGVYKEPEIFDHRKNKSVPEKMGSNDYQVSNLRLNTSKSEYIDNIGILKEHISRGDIYQANYTIKYKFNFEGSAYGLYNDLKSRQAVAYNVFAGLGDSYIISISPELFFCKDKEHMEVKPMKGTLKRGRTSAEDERNREFLANDIKNKSENIMIVDLLRNDLAKISQYGSVKAEKLFEVEKYNTLFQMTSTIESRVKSNVIIYELIRSVFPSGSVTGAPKIRSMEIIRDLEKEKRNIYTGSIGFFQPDGSAEFNVAIRTILINKDKGEMGIGGGIVYDSAAEDEFDECRLKARFLTYDLADGFKLIETMLYDRGYGNIGLHVERLKSSSEYFDYKFNENDILDGLNSIESGLGSEKYKVRLTLDKKGEVNVTAEKINSEEKDYKIIISDKKTDSEDISLYHKTTNRELYNCELKKAREKGYFDTIYLNEKNEITEGSITNVYIKKGDVFYTPPIECGLLNGVMRQIVIKEYSIKEKIITKEELINADEVYISNSIEGFSRAELV